jgi:3'-phosphoadenosine 5'-phosphosulfate sulfotransferase (PAPS reductase)/FAD synthetase
MSDLEQTAIERLKAASDMSLRLFEKPLVITYSGGKDSDVLLHLARASGIPFEVLHSLTTADAPEPGRLRRLSYGIKSKDYGVRSLSENQGGVYSGL